MELPEAGQDQLLQKQSDQNLSDKQFPELAQDCKLSSFPQTDWRGLTGIPQRPQKCKSLKMELN